MLSVVSFEENNFSVPLPSPPPKFNYEAESLDTTNSGIYSDLGHRVRKCINF